MLKALVFCATLASASNSVACPVPSACSAHPPPCDDADACCWKCAALTLVISHKFALEDMDKLRVAWAKADETADAQERLAIYATNEAKRLAQRPVGDAPWVKVVWGIGGALLGAGAILGASYALGAR
jgi:hypothetical protein